MREHLLITFTPAGNMELYFLDAKANSSLAYSADFMNRYEMQWIDPSPFGKTSLRSIDATANDALDSPGS